MIANVALALGAVGSLAFAWVAFLVIRFMVRVFLADPTVTFEFDEEAARAAPPADLVVEPQAFASGDGTPLAGVLVKSNEEPRGIVVFAPEFGGDAETWRRYAEFVPRAGYWLLAFDFRNTGKSGAMSGYVPRKWASEHEVADLRAAVAHARTLAGGRFAKVLLFGISRGGLSSLAVAQEDAGVPGVVLEGSGSTLEVVHTYTEKWSRVFAPERFCAAIPWSVYRAMSRFVLWISQKRVGYRFIEINELKAPASGGPCLFIHGQRDRHVTPKMAEQAFARWPGPKELWMAPGARHNGAVQKHPEEYRQRVLGHLAKLVSQAS